MHPLLRISLSLPLALLFGCGGGSGGDGTATSTPNSGALLLIDGEAGCDEALAARLAIVALERPDGTITPNLLPAETTVAVAHPAGSTTAVPLARPPVGAFDALHLYFVDGSATATLADGSRAPVSVGSAHQRIDLGGASVRPGQSPWFVVGHTAPVQLHDRGALVWRPTLYARVDEPHTVTDLRVRILAVDVASLHAQGSIAALSDLTVDLDFTTADRLENDGGVVTAEEFLTGLAIGTDLEVDAVLTGWRMLSVISAVYARDDAPSHGRGHKTEIFGTVLDVAPTTGEHGTISVRLQSIHHGGEDLPAERPLDLTLPFDEHTKVKLLHDRDHHHGHHSRYGTIADLAPGMLVKVHWHGPIDGHTATPHRVEIRRMPDGDQFHRLFEGQIGSLDATARTFVLAATTTVPEVHVRVTEDTILVRRTQAGTIELIAFEALAVGNSVAVLGVRGADLVVTAALVRVHE